MHNNGIDYGDTSDVVSDKLNCSDCEITLNDFGYSSIYYNET